MSTTQRLAAGFLCGALSVVIFHQGMILLLREIGMLPAAARVWSLAANPRGAPVLLNLCFWGGLYGAAFGALVPRLRVPMWLAGQLTGVAAILVATSSSPRSRARRLPAAGWPCPGCARS